MLGRIIFNADSRQDSLKEALDDVRRGKSGAAEKILRAAMMTRAIAHGDLKSLIENLVDVRETKREMKSREDADDTIIKRLDYLEETLEDQTKTLNKKLDRVISIFDRDPKDLIRQTALGQRSIIDKRGRELTQNIVTGRFESRAPGNRNAGSDKQDGMSLLKGILDYQKKIHAQNERQGKHVDRTAKLSERAQRVYERSRGRQGAPPAGSHPFLKKMMGNRFGFGNRAGGRPGPGLPGLPGGGFGLNDLIDMVPGGKYITGGAGGAVGSFLAKRALPFVGRSLPYAATIGTGLAAIDRIQRDKDKLIQPNTIKDFDSFLNFIDPRLAAATTRQPNPAGAPNRPGASGPNADLFKNLPEMVNPRGGPTPSIHALSPEGDAQIKALEEAKKELKKKIDELKKGRPARNFKDYRVDQTEKEIAGIDAQISSIRGGGVAGGSGGRNGAGGSSGPYIPGVTPGLGQSASQAQQDARMRTEQAQMPSYNPAFSPLTAAQGAGSLQIPGSSMVTPSGVTGLPLSIPGTPTAFNDQASWLKNSKEGEEARSRGSALIDYAVKTHGIPAEAAAGMIGNSYAESRFNTRASNENGESSHGLFQLNDSAAAGHRWSGFQKWAKENGRDESDPKAQIDYGVVEAKSMKMRDESGRTIWEAMNQAGLGTAEATKIWMHNFERPKVEDPDYRTEHSENALDAYKSGKYAGTSDITAAIPPGMVVPSAPRVSMTDIGPGTMGDAKNAMFATVNPNAAGAIGTGSVVEKQMAQAGIRKLPIQDNLKEQLQFAAEKVGVKVEIGSGGQPSTGVLGVDRTGSHRHDDGGAADLKLYETMPDGSRRLLDMSNPADAQKMQAFTEATVRAGATGVGAGPGYMGNSTLHIGGGTVASWGGASWIADALKNGRANSEANAKEFADWKAAKAAQAAAQTGGKPAEAGMPQSPAFPGAGTPGTPAAPAFDAVAMAPDAKTASIWSGKAPDDLKSRSLGAQLRAFKAASQENPEMAEAAGPYDLKTMNDMSPWRGQKNQPSAWAQDPQTLKWKPVFNNGSPDGAVAATSRTPTEMASPSGSFERQPTPPPPPPAPSANNQVPRPEKDDSDKKDDVSDGAGDPAGGSKKMSEIEMEINDFGQKALNTTDVA